MASVKAKTSSAKQSTTKKSPQSTATKPAKSDTKPATVRAWKAASSARPYRTFLCDRHLLAWTGSQLTSIECATGKPAGKMAADHGAPWSVGDEVWVPTKDGFAVCNGTLAIARKVETPIPKLPDKGGLRFISGFAKVCGDIAVRVVQTTQVTKVGTELRQDYLLYGFDTRSKKQLFLTPLASTSAPQVHGDCVADHFAVTFENGKQRVTGSLPSGTVRTDTQEYSNVVVLGGHLVDEPNGNNKFTPSVLVDGTWKKLACHGQLAQHGGHIYCVGHDELVRLDAKFDVAARTKIELPASRETSRIPLTTACASGGSLLVVECTKSWPASLREFDTPVAYRATWRDPVTLAEQKSVTFDEVFAVRLIGEVDGTHVASITNGFVGLRF